MKNIQFMFCIGWLVPVSFPLGVRKRDEFSGGKGQKWDNVVYI